MISKFNIDINLPKEFKTNNLGSLFHGALMENLSPEMTSLLHQSTGYSPLKQRLILEKHKSFVTWEIVSFLPTLSTEILNFFETSNTLHLKQHDIVINLESLIVEDIDLNSWIKNFWTRIDYPKFVTIQILSPISFKSDGSYKIFPDIRKFFRSLMLNFDAFFQEYKMYDLDTLDFIEKNVTIVDYNLRSTKFHLEGVKIPSFTGKLTFRINGTLPIMQLVHFLLAFGELSGVGIKTSLGMGKFKVIK